MKTRIISGAVALVLLVIIILLHSTVVFNIGFGLVGALMVYELSRAEKLEKEYAFWELSAVYALLTPVSVYFSADLTSSLTESATRFDRSAARLFPLILPYIAASFAYIVIITVVLLIRHTKISTGAFYPCTAYTLLISACMSSLCGIVKIFPKYAVVFLAFTFMGAWIADSGAYFAGTFFGKHKLCPLISPKKTVEGLIGGALTNALAFAALAVFANSRYEDLNLNVMISALIGVACCILGLVGDLTASLIKRECDIKDYGNIMPGHGGAMDRFDSVVYVAPFMLMAFALVTAV